MEHWEVLTDSPFLLPSKSRLSNSTSLPEVFRGDSSLFQAGIKLIFLTYLLVAPTSFSTICPTLPTRLWEEM